MIKPEESTARKWNIHNNFFGDVSLGQCWGESPGSSLMKCDPSASQEITKELSDEEHALFNISHIFYKQNLV